jgi:hypothetical protein
MVHQSLPIWLNDVVGWLDAKGIASGRWERPVRCLGCVVPYVR